MQGNCMNKGTVTRKNMSILKWQIVQNGKKFKWQKRSMHVCTQDQQKEGREAEAEDDS